MAQKVFGSWSSPYPIWLMIMIFWWDRALDKLVLSFSSIPLDFCSIKYLKLKLNKTYSLSSDNNSLSWTTLPICRLGHVKIIVAQCVSDIVFICSWHYLETIKATISGHCAATQRNGWCWWSVKHTMTNFYLASRASYWLQTIPVFQFKPNSNQIFKWWFFASHFLWNIPWSIHRATHVGKEVT